MAIGTANRHEGAVKPTSVDIDEHDGAIFARRVIEIPSNLQQRTDYNFPEKTTRYIGYAPKGLAEGTDGWLLQQFLYSLASFPNQVSARLIAYGNWTNRASETYE